MADKDTVVVGLGIGVVGSDSVVVSWSSVVISEVAAAGKVDVKGIAVVSTRVVSAST